MSLLSVAVLRDLRGFCHAQQVPGDDHRCHGVYRVVDVLGMQVVQVSQAQVVEVMAEIPQLQLVEKALRTKTNTFF